MADEACLDERFNKDKVWNRRELTLDVEAQAAESTAFSSLKDIWEENMLSMQPLFLFLRRNCPCLLLPNSHVYLVMTQAHLNNKSLVSWLEHTSKPTRLDV